MCQSHISELHQYIALFGLGSAGGASQCAEQDELRPCELVPTPSLEQQLGSLHESRACEMQLHVAEICGNRYFSSLLSLS